MNLKNGIYEITECLEKFLRNLIRGEMIEIYNCEMHMSGLFEIKDDEPIKYNELMSGKMLTETLRDMGVPTRERGAEFYYVLNLKVKSEDDPVQEITVKDMNSMNGNDAFSPHSPKVVGDGLGSSDYL